MFTSTTARNKRDSGVARWAAGVLPRGGAPARFGALLSGTDLAELSGEPWVYISHFELFFFFFPSGSMKLFVVNLGPPKIALLSLVTFHGLLQNSSWVKKGPQVTAAEP